YFTILKEDLTKAEGKILFTSDIWTDENYCPFIAITTHWISKDNTDHAGSLKLKSGLIAFHYIPSTHSGLNLTMIIL
ncbi:hypothetical protein SCLCIDRAFT_91816, partial [Scleroderma citrinum Foug A]